jgi:hypothetical protein
LHPSGSPSVPSYQNCIQRRFVVFYIHVSLLRRVHMQIKAQTLSLVRAPCKQTALRPRKTTRITESGKCGIRSRLRILCSTISRYDSIVRSCPLNSNRRILRPVESEVQISEVVNRRRRLALQSSDSPRQSCAVLTQQIRTEESVSDF